MKIIIALFAFFIVSESSFGQISLYYNFDSTWVVFNIDSIERTQFEDMYPYQSYIPVGRPGLTTFYDSALLFEDVDGDGTKEILGSSGHDANGPVDEITDEIAKNYSISVYEPQGLDYKLEHKYKNFDERIVGLADFEGDGDKDLFTLWFFYGYEIDPISNDSINVNRGGYHVYDIVSDSLIASWERFSSKNLPGGHVEVHSGPFIHYVNDIDSDGHAEMFFSFAQPNSIDSLSGYYCRSTLDGFYVFNKNTNTFDLKYDFSNLYNKGTADDWLKSFALGDLTNDGEPEFIIQGQARANTGLDHTHIWVFRPENGKLIPITHLDAYGQQFPNPKIMVTNDMDNNGHNELIMTNNMGGTAVYWFELINNELQLKRKAMILIPECITDTSLSVYNGFNGRIVDANSDGFDEIAFAGNFRAFVLGWNRITNEFMPYFNFHSENHPDLFYDIKRIYEPVPGSFVTRYLPLRIRGLHFWDITGDGLDDMILSYGYSIPCIGGSYLFAADPAKTKYLGPARVNEVSDYADKSVKIPMENDLKQNYPNPFNPTTKISFSLSSSENVTLEIYNILGQLVARLLNNKYIPSGKYTISWNASFHKSGVYFYRLTAGNKKYVKRMILMK